MTSRDQEFFVKGIRWCIKQFVDAGIIRPIKLGQPGPGIARDDVDRALAEFERALEQRFRRGGRTLARRFRYWLKRGSPAAGRSVRRLKKAPGGKIVYKTIRGAKKK